MAGPVFSDKAQRALLAAQKAGVVILSLYEGDFSTTCKEDTSPVTEADFASDEVLQKELSPSGYPILSEEVEDDLKRLSSETIWIIDPLDGTSDFVRRSGEFSVMIALIKNHTPVLGIVYQPTTDIAYVAEKGKGAHKRENDTWRALHISKTTKIQTARAMMSRSHLSQEEHDILVGLGITEILHRGSAGLKVGAVAEGNADIYFTTTGKIKQWDTAPAHCIIHEAGGMMTDMCGNDLQYNMKEVSHEKGVLVSNGRLHEEMVAHYKKHTIKT